MATLVDDRTDEQKQTHTTAVIGTDSFLSGWDGGSGGLSYAGWAFKDGELSEVLAWVDRRPYINRVRTVVLDVYRPKAAHTHIYVFGDLHRDNDALGYHTTLGGLR